MARIGPAARRLKAIGALGNESAIICAGTMAAAGVDLDSIRVEVYDAAPASARRRVDS